MPESSAATIQINGEKYKVYNKIPPKNDIIN